MRPATKKRAERKKPLSPAEIRQLGIRSRVTAEANGLCQECGAVGTCMADMRTCFRLLCRACNGRRSAETREKKKTRQGGADAALRHVAERVEVSASTRPHPSLEEAHASRAHWRDAEYAEREAERWEAAGARRPAQVWRRIAREARARSLPLLGDP